MITFHCYRENLEQWLAKRSHYFGFDRQSPIWLDNGLGYKNGDIMPITLCILDRGKEIKATANAKLTLTEYSALLTYARDRSYHEEREEVQNTVVDCENKSLGETRGKK